jgi:hypothetical protein
MRLAIGRLLETSKLINTKAGAELADFITYMSDFAEQVIRALNNGLTFGENSNAKVVKASLRHDTEQVIGTDGRSPVGIFPVRVHSSTTGVDQFSWYFNSSGQPVVKVALVGSPSATTDVSLVILFA